MESYLVTPLVLALALLGGTASLYNPQVQALWMWLAICVAPAGIYLIWRYRPAATPILAGAACVSILAMLANPAPYGYTLITWGLGLFAFGLFACCDPLPAIRAASIPWLVLYQPVTVALLDGSTNVYAIWCYVFAAAWLDASALALAPLAAVAIASGSRGAVLALLASLGAAWWHTAARWRAWIVAGGVAALIILFAIQPAYALRRFQYWHDALRISLIGAGPGSVARAGVIDIANGRPIPHAHNVLVDLLADYGLVGLAAAACGLWYARRLSWPRWVLLALLGLAVHGLVDNPLAWLGPVVIFFGMIGVSKNGKENI